VEKNVKFASFRVNGDFLEVIHIKNFNKSVVNELYAKWVKSYYINGNPLVIIKDNNKVA